ncbi:MAG: hypothetical protein E7249_09250 [Paenibacillaceae bacterium]|nr:hypothetical protein [Paenibacillaceae bacterium]
MKNSINNYNITEEENITISKDRLSVDTDFNKEIDRIQDMEYNIPKHASCSGITISWGLKVMNTEVEILADGTHLMKLFTYITSEESEKLDHKDIRVLLYKDFYDSPEEARRQGKLHTINNKSKLEFIRISVSMTGTVFDKLSSYDTNKLQDFYNKYELELDKAFSNRKDRNIKDLDTFTILAYKYKINSRLGIIRDIEQPKSKKHNLKCVSQGTIIKYTIIDTNTNLDLNLIREINKVII